MNLIPKTLTVELRHLKIFGTAMIRMWGGGVGFIEMTPEILDIDPKTIHSLNQKALKEEIKKNLNDGGFGCEEIIGAHVDVVAMYTHNTHYSVGSYYLGKSRNFTRKELNSFKKYEEAAC